MQFEWNEEKRREIYEERGIDILEAALIFESPVLTKQDNRHDYGEKRLISLGMVDDEAFIVVHTERDGVTRLITAWKGGKRERETYKQHIKNHFSG